MLYSRTAFCLASALLVTACGGLLDGGARRSALNAAGIQVRETGDGWEELRAPEGYHFAMPGVPQMQEESFQFRGVEVPQRFFDLSAQLNSMAYLVRVFDARALAPSDRERLREEGRGLFLPTGTHVVSERPYGAHRVVVIDGFGEMGNHRGLLHEFEENGFVWFMMVISEAVLGPPAGNDVFFASAGVDA